jgi:hypothetical protein
MFFAIKELAGRFDKVCSMSQRNQQVGAKSSCTSKYQQFDLTALAKKIVSYKLPFLRNETARRWCD